MNLKVFLASKDGVEFSEENLGNNMKELMFDFFMNFFVYFA